MTKEEKQYQDGVNSGYFLAKHDPELAAVIVNAAEPAKERSEYAFGLSIGRELYQSERMVSIQKEQAGLPVKETAPDARNPEKDYIKGFNSGYLLSKHDPDLARLLTTTQQETPNEYFKGLTAGKQEHEKEIREWSHSFSKSKPARDDRNLGKER